MALRKFNKNNFLLKANFKNNKRKNIRIVTVSIAIMILVMGILFFSLARYESNKDFSLINAKVGTYGDVVIAAVVDGENQSSFPDKSTYKLQNVECKDFNNNTITSMYDTNTWGMYIPEVNGKTKCVYTFTTSEVTEQTLNPTTATADSYTGSSGNLNGNTITSSTQLNLNDYKQNDQYHFNLGGGEQVTFPSGFYSSPINITNGSSGRTPKAISGMYYARPEHVTTIPCHGYTTMTISLYVAGINATLIGSDGTTLINIPYYTDPATVDVSDYDYVNIQTVKYDVGGSYGLQ